MPLDHFTLKYTVKWISLRSQMQNWMISSYKMAIHQWLCLDIILRSTMKWKQFESNCNVFLFFCMYYFRVYRGTLCSQYPLCTKYFSQCSLLCTIDFWFLARGSWLRGPLQQIHFVNLLVATFFSSPAQTEWIYFMHFHSI